MNQLMNLATSYFALAVLVIGVLAFLVSCVAEVMKGWKWFDKNIPTAVSVIILALIICPLSMLSLLAYFGIAVEWYMVFASFIAAFIVALVSMDGWERVTALAERFVRK